MTQSVSGADDNETQQLARDLCHVVGDGDWLGLDDDGKEVWLRISRELRSVGWSLGDEDTHRNLMRALAMEIVGRFSHVQELIVETLVDWGTERLSDIDITDPRVEKLLAKLSKYNNPPDDLRRDLVKAFAKALASDVILDEFGSVYQRAKEVRDSLGHGAVQYFDDDGALVVQKLHGEPTVLTREELMDSVRDCQWLDAQVMYLAVTGAHRNIHPVRRDGTTGEELHPIRPTMTPESWDGILYS